MLQRVGLAHAISDDPQAGSADEPDWSGPWTSLVRREGARYHFWGTQAPMARTFYFLHHVLSDAEMLVRSRGP